MDGTHWHTAENARYIARYLGCLIIWREKEVANGDADLVPQDTAAAAEATAMKAGAQAATEVLDDRVTGVLTERKITRGGDRDVMKEGEKER